MGYIFAINLRTANCIYNLLCTWIIVLLIWTIYTNILSIKVHYLYTIYEVLEYNDSDEKIVYGNKLYTTLCKNPYYIYIRIKSVRKHRSIYYKIN